jgi:hypothetical protein
VNADFRDNLIIDRYDPAFATMDVGKLDQMRCEDSKSTLTWNVFRSLRRIDPQHWLWPLQQMALPGSDQFSIDCMTVSLWQQLSFPVVTFASNEALRSRRSSAEIDVIFQGPKWVWFIDVLYKNDIAMGTAGKPTLDLILQKINAGSHYAGERDFYFSLLILSEEISPVGALSVEAYENPVIARERLAFQRPDGMPNFQTASTMTWSMLASTLSQAADTANRPDEVMTAYGAGEWMVKRGLVGQGG